MMRASGETQVISAKTRPAPPNAREPRWTRWKSPGRPSIAEYIAIGETTMRLASVTPRALKGVNIGGAGARVRLDVDLRLLGEPALVILEPRPVAQAQVFVADALRARQHANT